MIPTPPENPRAAAPPTQTRPKANDPGTPHPSATPTRFRSSASWARRAQHSRLPAPRLPRVSPAAISARWFVSSVACAPHRPYQVHLRPLVHQFVGHLMFEQFNGWPSLPDRCGREGQPLKVAGRDGVAAGVSGGREGDAAGGVRGGPAFGTRDAGRGPLPGAGSTSLPGYGMDREFAAPALSGRRRPGLKRGPGSGGDSQSAHLNLRIAACRTRT
jgi:hypothetical protein